MRQRKSLITAALALLALGAGAWGQEPEEVGAPTRKGHLVIVGGGLRKTNAPVYRRVLDLLGPEGRLGILPTASGVPAESGPGTAEDFRFHAGEGRVVEVIDLTTANPEKARDPETVASIAACRGLWFTGGVQSRIVEVFRPSGGDTPAYEAARAVLERGGVVAGSSAGAAMMSDPMIAWGRSDEALLVGAVTDVGDRGVGIERGMGFFPFGLSGQHFLRRGRAGRMIAALEHTGRRFGWGVADNRALHVDLATGVLEALGSHAILQIDRGAARRKGLDRSGLRLALLSDGDRSSGKDGVVTPRAGKTRLAPGKIVAKSGPLGPWDRDAFTELILRLASDPNSSKKARGRYFEIELSADETTRFWATAADPETLCASGVLLSVRALDGAEKRAAELRREIEEARRRARAAETEKESPDLERGGDGG